LPGSGLAGDGYARDGLEVVDEADVPPVAQEICYGVALAVADFEREQAVGLEDGVGLRDEAAVDVEAVGAGEERAGGLVVADLGMEGAAVGEGDVGRVGDDRVVLFWTRFARGCGFLAIRGCQVVQQVGLEEADAMGEVVARGVCGGDCEGGR